MNKLVKSCFIIGLIFIPFFYISQNVIGTNKIDLLSTYVINSNYDLVFDNVSGQSLPLANWINKSILVRSDLHIATGLVLKNSTLYISPINDDSVSITVGNRADTKIENSLIIDESTFNNEYMLSVRNASEFKVINSQIITYSDAIIFDIDTVSYIKIINTSIKSFNDASLIKSINSISFDIENNSFNEENLNSVSTRPFLDIKESNELTIKNNYFNGIDTILNIQDSSNVKFSGNDILNFNKFLISTGDVDINLQINKFTNGMKIVSMTQYSMFNYIKFRINDFINISASNFDLEVGNYEVNYSNNYYSNQMYSTDLDYNGIADQAYYTDKSPLYYSIVNYRLDGDKIILISIYKLQNQNRNFQGIIGIGLLPIAIFYLSILTLIILFSVLKLYNRKTLNS